MAEPTATRKTDSAPRLIMVTPAAGAPDAVCEALESGLAAAMASPVAAVLLASGQDEQAALVAAKTLVPVAQAHGAAALILNDTRIAGRSGADGVHIESGSENLELALSTFHPDRIVGAGGIRSRHAAMTAAEMEPDYVFFGRHDGDTHPQPHPRLLALASWWAPLMTVPAVALAGTTRESIWAAKETGAEFVAIGRYWWRHEQGAAAAVLTALSILDGAEPRPEEAA